MPVVVMRLRTNGVACPAKRIPCCPVRLVMAAVLDLAGACRWHVLDCASFGRLCRHVGWQGTQDAHATCMVDQNAEVQYGTHAVCQAHNDGRWGKCKNMPWDERWPMQHA